MKVKRKTLLKVRKKDEYQEHVEKYMLDRLVTLACAVALGSAVRDAVTAGVIEGPIRNFAKLPQADKEAVVRHCLKQHSSPSAAATDWN
jgi:hypothetical protein